MAEIEGGGMPKGMEVVRALGVRPLETATRRFYFLRHGQTDGNLNRIYQGPETPLNATGLAQAEAAAEKLRERPVARLLASDMARAWRTAEAVAATTGASPYKLAWLRERSFGDLIGSSSVDIDWASFPPNGETPSGFVARARTGLAHGISQGDDTLMVAHGGLLYVLSAMLSTRMTGAHFANATPLLFERAADDTWTATIL